MQREINKEQNDEQSSSFKASSSTATKEEALMMLANQSLISDSEPPTKDQIKNPTLLFDGTRTLLVGQEEHEKKKTQGDSSSSSSKLFGTSSHPIPADSQQPTKMLHRIPPSFGLPQYERYGPRLEKVGKVVLLEDAPPNTARCSVTATNSVAAAAPELPPQFYDQITRVHGGTNIKLLTQKLLERTDLSESHARLALPQSSISRDNINFLTAAEAQELLVKNANGKLGSIGVTVIDPKLNTYQMKLGKWFYAQSKNKNSEKERGFSYILKAGWTKVLKCNEFEVGDVLQIWSFRIEAQLGIALVAAAPLFPTWGRRARRT